jgi:hypothetical protein
MASTVLSGASNPSYRNNTDQNVRIVINYMSSNATNDLTITWAGVGVGGRFETSTVIGRNLAFSTVIERTASGTIQRIFSGTRVNDRFEQATGQLFRNEFQNVATDVDISLALNSNNASGQAVALPTELILAPGQIFSCVCGVHNIVVIPELG